MAPGRAALFLSADYTRHFPASSRSAAQLQVLLSAVNHSFSLQPRIVNCSFKDSDEKLACSCAIYTLAVDMKFSVDIHGYIDIHTTDAYPVSMYPLNIHIAQMYVSTGVQC